MKKHDTATIAETPTTPTASGQEGKNASPPMPKNAVKVTALAASFAAFLEVSARTISAGCVGMD
jgi:hypothetical protein